ncbi:hypothetical protein [Corynebacterium sp.]|uniref:hypothetical protein n=1 Tax=Corynebacterium sp. TaxID=1720 RepID=UPI0026E0B40A|nr:hypothetical protein [Corynebacterium sp.]MDO5513398.1 hypothetical protein [Corynebacterium sp.]
MGRKVIAILAVIALVAALVFAFIGGSTVGMLRDPVSVEVESDGSEVITAVQREEQIVLLSTATQGLHKTQSRLTALGWDVPGTARTNFLQYSYQAKLGLEGSAVRIEKTGEDRFLITVPEFIFIGYTEPTFETVLEDGQILSFVSPDIDTAAIITEILGDHEKREHITANRSLLQDQTRAFYRGIVAGIDEQARVEFAFR